MYYDILVYLVVLIIIFDFVYRSIKIKSLNFNPKLMIVGLEILMVAFIFANIPSTLPISVVKESYKYRQFQSVIYDNKTIYNLENIDKYEKEAFEYSLEANNMDYDYIDVNKTVDGKLCTVDVEYRYDDKFLFLKKKTIYKYSCTYKIIDKSKLEYITSDSEIRSIIFGLFKGLYF